MKNLLKSGNAKTTVFVLSFLFFYFWNVTISGMALDIRGNEFKYYSLVGILVFFISLANLFVLLKFTNKKFLLIFLIILLLIINLMGYAAIEYFYFNLPLEAI